MTPIEHWRRYGATWSLPRAQRDSELAACVAENATYCDVNGRIGSRDGLSDYMGGFQESQPGAKFEILEALEHEGGTLSRWVLRGPEGEIRMRGTSYASRAADGRFQAINGFFHAEATSEAA